jgi:hypothetical protein
MPSSALRRRSRPFARRRGRPPSALTQNPKYDRRRLLRCLSQGGGWPKPDMSVCRHPTLRRIRHLRQRTGPSTSGRSGDLRGSCRSPRHQPGHARCLTGRPRATSDGPFSSQVASQVAHQIFTSVVKLSYRQPHLKPDLTIASTMWSTCSWSSSRNARAASAARATTASTSWYVWSSGILLFVIAAPSRDGSLACSTLSLHSARGQGRWSCRPAVRSGQVVPADVGDQLDGSTRAVVQPDLAVGTDRDDG